jgi:glycogen synthase
VSVGADIGEATSAGSAIGCPWTPPEGAISPMTSLIRERLRSRHPASAKPLRIAFAGPPGNVIGTFRHWREGREDPTQVSRTGSGQFFEVCERLGARALVIVPFGARTPQETELIDGPIHIICHRYRADEFRGLRYHLSLLRYGLWLIASIVRFRADVVVVAQGVHWPLLVPLAVLGYKIVPAFGCGLWPRNKPLRPRKRLMLRMDSILFRWFSLAIISQSEGISEQIRMICGGRTRPILEFLPTFLPGAIEARDPPDEGPFRVLFAGRIERDKGVFDVLAIARRFFEGGGPEMTFELCGDGSALEDLKAAAAAAGLPPERFRCRGHLTQPGLPEAFSGCHAVIVPTTSDSIEGLNQVVIEAIMATRPVVTSRICPAIRYVRDGVVEVPPDDVRAYGDALLRLCTDPDFYRQKRQGCWRVRDPFYDPRNGWAAALESIFEAAQEGREPTGRTVPLEPDWLICSDHH